MKRDFNKLIAEGGQIIKQHERIDMTLNEATALIEATEPGNVLFTIWDAYRAGVAAGARITSSETRTNRRAAQK